MGPLLMAQSAQGSRGSASEGMLKPPASPHCWEGESLEVMSRMKLRGHNSVAGSAQPLPGCQPQPLSPGVHEGLPPRELDVSWVGRGCQPLSTGSDAAGESSPGNVSLYMNQLLR